MSSLAIVFAPQRRSTLGAETPGRSGIAWTLGLFSQLCFPNAPEPVGFVLAISLGEPELLGFVFTIYFLEWARFRWVCFHNLVPGVHPIRLGSFSQFSFWIAPDSVGFVLAIPLREPDPIGFVFAFSSQHSDIMCEYKPSLPPRIAGPSPSRAEIRCGSRAEGVPRNGLG